MTEFAGQGHDGSCLRGVLSRCAVGLWSVSFLLLYPASPGGLRAACDSSGVAHSTLREIPALVKASDWPDLEAAGREVIRLCPSAAQGHYWLGAAVFNQNRFFASARSLRRSVDLGYGEAHLALAQAYSELDQGHFFKEELEAAKRLTPEKPAVYFVEGKYFYEKERRLDLAEEAFRRVIELEPKHFKARYRLGLCLLWTGRIEEAEATLLEAAKIADAQRSSGHLSYQYLAEFYLESERPEKALPFAQKAVEVNSESSRCQFLLGKCQWKLKHPEAAIAALRKAIALDNTYSEPKYLLGRIYLTRGDRAKAAGELESFRELEKLYGRAAR